MPVHDLFSPTLGGELSVALLAGDAPPPHLHPAPQGRSRPGVNV